MTEVRGTTIVSCIVCHQPFDFDHMGVLLKQGGHVHYPACLEKWEASQRLGRLAEIATVIASVDGPPRTDREADLYRKFDQIARILKGA